MASLEGPRSIFLENSRVGVQPWVPHQRDHYRTRLSKYGSGTTARSTAANGSRSPTHPTTTRLRYCRGSRSRPDIRQTRIPERFGHQHPLLSAGRRVHPALPRLLRPGRQELARTHAKRCHRTRIQALPCDDARREAGTYLVAHCGRLSRLCGIILRRWTFVNARATGGCNRIIACPCTSAGWLRPNGTTSR